MRGMRVLIVGGGGREHALAWSCLRHQPETELLCAPGNGGTALLGENVALSPTDATALAQLATQRSVDLVILGPDAAIDAGVGDACRAARIPVFGPSAAAGRIESSKTFAKRLMDDVGVPTASWCAADASDRDAAVRFAADRDGRVVVKADGLALGKGVIVCASIAEAEAALDACLVDQRFGAASSRVVVEERLVGPEVSFFALCDGRNAVALGAASDHKRAHDGDRGPNTGGMGAVTPPLDRVPDTGALLRISVDPILAALADRGTPFRGCLFVGLLLTNDGPRVLEYNARFGDPETQALVATVDTDLLPVLSAVAHGDLRGSGPISAAGVGVCVVVAAQGYPDAARSGDTIRGLEDLDADVLCFHAGTRRDPSGAVLTAGGRVLGVVGRGTNTSEARERAYAGAEVIDFPGRWYRRDIGARAASASVPRSRE